MVAITITTDADAPRTVPVIDPFFWASAEIAIASANAVIVAIRGNIFLSDL